MGQRKYTPTCVKFQGDMMREERVRVYFARPTIAIAKIRLLGIYKEYGV